MKKIFTILLIVPFLSLNTNAQTSELVKYLPQKAAIVIDIDGSSLSQKISRQDLMDLKFFDSIFKKAKAGSKKMVVDPSESGINNKDHFFVIMEMQKPETGGSVTVFGKVADESKLSQTLQNIEEKSVTRKTVGQNKMMMSEHFVVGWNNSVFVVHATWSGTKTKLLTSAEKKKELLAMEKTCIELLTPNKQTVITNKNFETFTQSKGDFKIWIDNKSMINDFTKKGPFSAFKMNNFMQPDHQVMVVNFEKGKVVTNSYAYYDASTLPAVKNVYGEKLNPELFKRIPAGNLFGLYAMSFKPGGVKNFIESSGMLKQFKREDKEPGFDPALLFDNLKGDVIVAVTMPEQAYSDKEESKNPFSNLNLFFAATVKDEGKVNKLIDSVKLVFEEKRKQKQVDTTDDGQVVKESEWFKDVKLSTKVENGIFYLMVNSAKQNDFVSSTRYDAIFKEYGQRPTLMMFDMKTLMSMLMGFMKKAPHSNDQSEIFAMFEVFDKMITSGGQFENDVMVTTQEVKFTDVNENGLKQMLKMIDFAFSAIINAKSKATVRDLEIKEN